MVHHKCRGERREWGGGRPKTPVYSLLDEKACYQSSYRSDEMPCVKLL
jgi:hypothetical protein